ncbi:MAG: AarF/ABC1/UbiB kinase family protein [Polyangiaceae bacterium]|nr:AarF/ABC1/UbiB kinase family protein [Polyangiaceae bacterium]
MRPIALALRALFIALVFALALARYAAARLLGRGREPAARDRLRGDVLASALTRLGATFVKLGQIMATRPDVLPEGLIAGLAGLQDDVPAAPISEVHRTLAREWSFDARRLVADIDPAPLAAASVAQVYRGTLRDGRRVAIKVQRWSAARHIEGDLSIMEAFARVIDWLPGMRYVSLPGSVGRFASALREQIDFRIEADNNRRLARNFDGDAVVRVPWLVDELCTRRVLVMELVDGIKPTEVQVGRRELAQAGFRCIAKMVFVDGFVHADMHPGNMLFTRAGEVYLIDTGLCAEIPREMRKPWSDTFLAVALGDGRRAAELFWGYAPVVHGSDFDGFARDVAAHLTALRGRPIEEIEVSRAVGGAMGILRRHRVQVDPIFTVVNLAMLVAEGIGKQLDPGFDVYAGAMPYLAEAALLYPTGTEPTRPAGRAAARQAEDRA